jgi:O-antigen ligase
MARLQNCVHHSLKLTGLTVTSPKCLYRCAVPGRPKTVICYAYYVFIFSLPLEGALGGLSLLGLILAGLTLWQPSLFFKALPKGFWCFVTYLFVVAGLGLLTVLDSQYDPEFARAVIIQLFRLLQLLVFFLIACKLMTFESIAQRSLLIFSFSCVVFTVLQLVGVISTEVVGNGRITSLEYNPNTVAMLLSVGLLSIVGLTYGRNDAGMKLRLLALTTCGILLLMIVRTGSRGSQLALALAFIALVLKPAGMPKVKTVLAVVAVIVSLVWAASRIDAVRERWEATYYEGEIAGRDVLMSIAWEMVLERPIVGWGPVNRSYEMGIRTGNPVDDDPHNLYLWILVETGLFGASPFIIGLWLCLRSAWAARNGASGTLPLALLVLMLANSTKGTYLFFKIFWFVLAYALASGGYAMATAPHLVRKKYRRSPRVLSDALT